MRRALPFALLLFALPLFATRAAADIAPAGGYRYTAPVEESLAVAAFRVPLREVLTSAERDRWMAPVPRCRGRTQRRFVRYFSDRCSSGREDIRHVVGDRLVRWVLPHLLVARGDADRARALMELPPLQRTRDVASMLDALAGDDPAFALARRALEEDSIEAVGRHAAQLVVLALQAGAPRAPMLESLRGFMILLTEPNRLRGRFTVEVEHPTEGRAWSAAFGRVRAAEECLRAENERTGWSVEVRIVARFAHGRAFVASSVDGELGRCVEQAIEAPSRHEPPEGTEARAVLRYSLRPEALFTRVDVDGP